MVLLKKPCVIHKAFPFVGMARFELAAPRPPDEYSNLAELHPEAGVGLVVGVSVGMQM